MCFPPIPSFAPGFAPGGQRCAKYRKEDPCKTLPAVN
jgi:hypothetical protein